MWFSSWPVVLTVDCVLNSFACSCDHWLLFSTQAPPSTRLTREPSPSLLHADDAMKHDVDDENNNNNDDNGDGVACDHKNDYHNGHENLSDGDEHQCNKYNTKRNTVAQVAGWSRSSNGQQQVPQGELKIETTAAMSKHGSNGNANASDDDRDDDSDNHPDGTGGASDGMNGAQPVALTTAAALLPTPTASQPGSAVADHHQAATASKQPTAAYPAGQPQAPLAEAAGSSSDATASVPPVLQLLRDHGLATAWWWLSGDLAKKRQVGMCVVKEHKVNWDWCWWGSGS